VATLHTSDSVQTINRIGPDVSPGSSSKQQIRTQLSFRVFWPGRVLPAARAGRSTAAGARAGVAEVLLVKHPAVRALIPTTIVAHQIYSIIQTNRKAGMKTMNQGLRAELLLGQPVSHEEVLSHSGERKERRVAL
jgi:Tfp pilus assembly pilus retraction ATPase PilT